MKFTSLEPATFIQRDNRFRVQVRVAGRTQAAHLPNSGRLEELLVPGRQVWVVPIDLARRPKRRTAYDLALVEYAGRLVSVDARLPSHLVAEALQKGQLAEFERYTDVRREVNLGQSRIDFQLYAEDDPAPCWIEVKSVTLVKSGTARFPDAPTARGRRHVRELIEAVKQGHQAAVAFVIQRDDAQRFTPHDQADPAFGQVLRQAAQSGVRVHAWRCQVSRASIQLLDQVPVDL